MEPTYNFPVLRGIQAGREYYIAMCPLKLVPKLFVYDEEVVPPELRAQRSLNKSRIPVISNYLINHPQEYVFSALTASIDTLAEFIPLENNDDTRNVGWLIIPMDATIIINDGQHRRAAIEEAIKERPELGDDSIAVVFFIDNGLKRAQQMFADLNKHAVRPSRSLGILYDHRDPMAILARDLMMQVPVFKNLTEKEKTSISNRSPKLFTLSSIYQATQALLQISKTEEISKTQKDLALDFWNTLTDVIPEWGMASRKEIPCAALREGYIFAHGVALHALGIAGADLLSTYPSEWKDQLQKLNNLDWSRTNSDVWEGRAMVQGRISKASRHVTLTANLIKMTLSVPLRADEERLEKSFMELNRYE